MLTLVVASPLYIVCPGVLKQAGIDVAPTTGRLCTDWRDSSPTRKKNSPADYWHVPDTTYRVGGRHSGRMHHWDGLPSSCQVNLKEGVLQIGKEEVPLSTPQVLEPNCYRCCAESSMMLPPKSETLVPARVEGEWKRDSKWALLQPEKTVFS